MKPYYDHDGITLYHCDAWEWLSEKGYWGDRDFDLMITDPPYTSQTHTGARTNKKGIETTPIDFEPISDDELMRILVWGMARVNGWGILTCGWQQLPILSNLSCVKLVRVGVWVKTNPMPQISGDRPGQGHEMVVCLYPDRSVKLIKERTKRIGWNGREGKKGSAAVWETSIAQRTGHPTAKPVSLYMSWIKEFGGERILDPFAGRGTTGIAAKTLNKQAVLIEKSEKYCELIAENMDKTQRPTMFQMEMSNA